MRYVSIKNKGGYIEFNLSRNSAKARLQRAALDIFGSVFNVTITYSTEKGRV